MNTPGRFSNETIGNYNTGRVIGSGTFGEVYNGTGPNGEDVALKFLLSAFNPLDPNSRNAKTLFEREANVLGMLSHPNIVPYLGYFLHNDLGLEFPYIVMKFANEGSLQDALMIRGKLQISESIDILTQVARGLHYAHSKKVDAHGNIINGVLHRDLKPANILLERDQSTNRVIAMLSDFGITISAHSLMTMVKNITTNFVQLPPGTLAYMSPEQFIGGERIPSDIYSLGVIAYYLITARLPIQLQHNLAPHLVFRAYESAHLNDLPPSFQSLGITSRPELELEPIIQKSLLKDPNKRHQTASEFDNDLTFAYRAIVAYEQKQQKIFDISRTRSEQAVFVNAERAIYNAVLDSIRLGTPQIDLKRSLEHLSNVGVNNENSRLPIIKCYLNILRCLCSGDPQQNANARKNTLNVPNLTILNDFVKLFYPVLNAYASDSHIPKAERFKGEINKDVEFDVVNELLNTFLLCDPNNIEYLTVTECLLDLTSTNEARLISRPPKSELDWDILNGWTNDKAMSEKLMYVSKYIFEQRNTPNKCVIPRRVNQLPNRDLSTRIFDMLHFPADKNDVMKSILSDIETGVFEFSKNVQSKGIRSKWDIPMDSQVRVPSWLSDIGGKGLTYGYNHEHCSFEDLLNIDAQIIHSPESYRNEMLNARNRILLEFKKYFEVDNLGLNNELLYCISFQLTQNPLIPRSLNQLPNKGINIRLLDMLENSHGQDDILRNILFDIANGYVFNIANGNTPFIDVWSNTVNESVLQIDTLIRESSKANRSQLLRARHYILLEIKKYFEKNDPQNTDLINKISVLLNINPLSGESMQSRIKNLWDSI